MKSLRTEIAAITLISITVISALVMWVSIRVYEGLYEDFVSKELNALSENLANDLLPFMSSSEDTFSLLSILLKLDEYDNVEFAKVFSQEGELLTAYVGSASDEHTVQQTESGPAFDRQLFSLQHGLFVEESHIRVVRIIGDPALPQGKLVISYLIEQSLKASQQRFISSIVPFVIFILLAAVLCVIELQRRSLLPLFELIDEMRRIEETKDYAVEVNVEGKTEIKALTHGFNSMMSDINKQAELNRQKNKLLTRQQEQMEKLANFDPLTGLPNRQFLMKCLSIELSRAKRENSNVALLFLDLDGFKMVNDSFGHDVGDKLLCKIADLVSENLRADDIVGRLGGDEFVIILSAETTFEQVEEVANRLVSVINEEQFVDQWRLETGASIGVALAKDCEYNLTTLMSNADIAMYHSKRNGRGQFTLFTRMMQDDNHRIIRISTSIISALENDEFYLVYQPKVNQSGHIVAFEALIRWYNAHLGIVSPAEFIPIAEQSNKVSAITQWVVQQVCNDIDQILGQYGESTSISLNLSANDLKDDSVTGFVLEKIKLLGKRASAIEFEITESAYLKSFQAGNKFFEDLRTYGCKIALDDFGTGYSSLSYLTEFNIDTLKIDRQFVSQIGVSQRSELITVTILEMARHLKLTVCAEGVETLEQANFLIDHGCHTLQGYYYGKPEPLSSQTTDSFLPDLNKSLS